MLMRGAILGHANLRTISRYVHPTQQNLDAAMRMLAPAGEVVEQAVQ